MNVFSVVVSSVSMLSAVVAIFFAIKNGHKANVDEVKQRVEENTKINLKLDAITNNVSDIKSTVQEINKEVQKHSTQLTQHELQIKELERRIVELEKAP